MLARQHKLFLLYLLLAGQAFECMPPRNGSCDLPKAEISLPEIRYREEWQQLILSVSGLPDLSCKLHASARKHHTARHAGLQW